MRHRPVRNDYRRWLETQAAAASGDAPHATLPPPALPPLPATLPFAGYVVWCYGSVTYLDIRFDHHRFEIVTQQVPRAAEAFYFDSLDAAYAHAADVGEPCLILFAETADAPVRIAG